jgi:hypothetical protein
MPHFLKSCLLWLTDVLPDISNLLLGLLGVLMSFPDKAGEIEKDPFWRKTIAYTCIVIALAGLAASRYQRRQASSQMSTLTGNVNLLVTNTNNLVTSTNSTVTLIGAMLIQLGTLNSRLNDLDRQVVANKGNPQAIASLRAQIAATQDQTSKVSKQFLLSMARGVANDIDSLAETQQVDEDRVSHTFLGNHQMGFMKLGWAQRNQPSMATADYLRQQLLQELPPSVRTSEDADEAKTFTFASTGGLVTADDLKKAARYLRELASRVAAQVTSVTPAPPQ